MKRRAFIGSILGIAGIGVAAKQEPKSKSSDVSAGFMSANEVREKEALVVNITEVIGSDGKLRQYWCGRLIAEEC